MPERFEHLSAILAKRLDRVRGGLTAEGGTGRALWPVPWGRYVSAPARKAMRSIALYRGRH